MFGLFNKKKKSLYDDSLINEIDSKNRYLKNIGCLVCVFDEYWSTVPIDLKYRVCYFKSEKIRELEEEYETLYKEYKIAEYDEKIDAISKEIKKLNSCCLNCFFEGALDTAMQTDIAYGICCSAKIRELEKKDSALYKEYKITEFQEKSFLINKKHKELRRCAIGKPCKIDELTGILETLKEVGK